TVSALISSLYPFSQLYGVTSSRSATLAELLQPRSFRGKYAMCMIVSLQLDDPSAFSLDGASTPEFQAFPIVPGVTHSETVLWTLTPTSTFGAASVDHRLSVDVAFDAQQSCKVGARSLLQPGEQGGESAFAYHLVSTAHNTVLFAHTTVNNQ